MTENNCPEGRGDLRAKAEEAVNDEQENRQTGKEKKASVTAALALLAERFPRTFFIYERRRQPLKVGIYDDIRAVIGDAITAEELSTTVAIYVANGVYLRACCRKGTVRIDLDGRPAGVVSHDESKYARARLIALKSFASQALRERDPHRVLAANNLDVKTAARLVREQLPKRQSKGPHKVEIERRRRLMVERKRRFSDRIVRSEKSPADREPG
jgi:sRNA-binding protein